MNLISKRKIIIKSKYIYLKTLKTSDYSLRYKNWLNDKHINKFLEIRHNKHNKKNIIEFIKTNIESQNSILFGIFLCESDIHIGNIRLSNIDINHLTTEISYFLGDKDYHNKGIMSHAIKLLTNFCFKKLKLRKIYAGIYRENIPSKKTLLKNGFKKTAHIKNFFILEKKLYSDKLIYELNK